MLCAFCFPPSCNCECVLFQSFACPFIARLWVVRVPMGSATETGVNGVEVALLAHFCAQETPLRPPCACRSWSVSVSSLAMSMTILVEFFFATCFCVEGGSRSIFRFGFWLVESRIFRCFDVTFNEFLPSSSVCDSIQGRFRFNPELEWYLPLFTCFRPTIC